MILEVQHDELSMNEDSDETMNEDKEGSRSTVRFLESESVKKSRNALLWSDRNQLVCSRKYARKVYT